MSKNRQETVSYGKLIDALLDDAFTVLQHDTGDYDPEWHASRKWLAERFKKTLAKRLGNERHKGQS